VKIEVLCPSCGNGYLVDESDIPVTGGEVPCASCGNTIRISAGEVLQTEGKKGPLDRRAVPREERAEETAATPDSREQVVCPRCGLHFSPRKSRHAESRGSRPAVLVVEDMEYFLAIARDALAEKFDVRTARTVDEAFQALNRGRVDLLVLDLTLDGGEHGMRVLESLQPKPCPIVIFTAEDEADMYGDRWEKLQELGADDLVLKGMHVGETLARKVGALLGEIPEEDDMTA
jgi:predicted Zn finger-like uncharacterized protein